MIGARKDKNGKAITGAGRAQVMVGVNVPGNTILGLGISKNKDGSFADGKNGKMARATLAFQQSNGSIFSHTFFDSDKDWGQDKLTMQLLHVCLPFLGNDPLKFYDIVETNSDGTFVSVIQALAANVFAAPVAAQTKVSLKLVYLPNRDGDFFASFPKYLNWIELDGTTPTTLVVGTGDIYERPTQTEMSEEGTVTPDTEVVVDNAPF
tara:strand:- start:8551 stop:9174 length:624 start_codon:yes stop_codon:yes gene_type:complete